MFFICLFVHSYVRLYVRSYVQMFTFLFCSFITEYQILCNLGECWSGKKSMTQSYGRSGPSKHCITWGGKACSGGLDCIGEDHANFVYSVEKGKLMHGHYGNTWKTIFQYWTLNKPENLLSKPLIKRDPRYGIFQYRTPSIKRNTFSTKPGICFIPPGIFRFMESFNTVPSIKWRTFSQNSAHISFGTQFS